MQAWENFPELILCGDLFHLLARVGYGDKLIAVVLCLVEKVLLEDVRLESGTGLCADDEEGVCDIDFFREVRNLCRIG